MEIETKYLHEITSNCKKNLQKINKDKLKEAICFLKETNNSIQLIETILKTAVISSKIGADEEIILAYLLHNCCEEEKCLELKKKFGEKITELIESLNKIINIEKQNKDKLNEIAETALLASANEPKLIILRLIVQIQRIKTAKKEKTKEKECATETIKIYVPIAHKLGIYSIKALMEDYAFELLEPEKFNQIKKEKEKIIAFKKKEFDEFISILSNEIKKNKIKIEITSRTKTVYGIYEKMKKKNKQLKEIYDVNAIRIIAETIDDCYTITGIINSKWKNIPEEYDDYISKPKTNFYQSIHMAIIGPEGKPVEIQIRTKEMHEIAEYGIASHSMYKGNKKNPFDFSLNLFNQIKKIRKEKEKIEFKIESEKIIALTPESEAIILPVNSTPIDFAYAVHSELGKKCEKVKVNGKLVPLDYRLTNLDSVEIITSNQQTPKLSWLSFVKTGKARAKINQFFNILNPKKKEISFPKNVLRVKEKDPKIKLAKCCSPLPGEEIIAITTTKRKYSIHQKNCSQIEKLKEKEKLTVEWGQDSINQKTEIMISAKEKPNLLIEIIKKIDSTKTNITNAKVITKEKTLKIIIQLNVKNITHLDKIINEITKINGIIKVKRN